MDFVLKLVDEADAPLSEAPALRVEEGLVVSEGLLVPRERLKIASIGLLVEAGARVEPGVVIRGRRFFALARKSGTGRICGEAASSGRAPSWVMRAKSRTASF